MTDQVHLTSAVQSEASSDIWRRRGELDKSKRAEIAEATKDIRARYHELDKALWAKCAAIGHKWRFSGLGVFSHIHWYVCNQCGATKSEDPTLDDPLANAIRDAALAHTSQEGQEPK